MMRDAGQGRIDALRNLVNLNDKDVVSMTTLEGAYEIPDPDTHEMTWKFIPSGDRAIVIVGPTDQLNGVIRIDKETKTATFELGPFPWTASPIPD